MKKLLAFLLFVIILIITYFIQINIFNTLTILNIKPNLFLIELVIFSIFLNKNYSFIFGAICGLILDFNFGKTIGIYALCFSTISYLVGTLTYNFSKESRLTQIIAIFLATILFNIFYALILLCLKTNINLWTIIKTTIIEAIYNSLLLIILSKLLIIICHKLEFFLGKKQPKKTSIFIS